MIKATRGQVNYLLEIVKTISLEDLKQLPVPSELIRYREGYIDRDKMKEILSDFSIQEAQNVVYIINDYLKEEV